MAKRIVINLLLTVFSFTSPLHAFSDNSVSYRYGSAFKEPAVSGGDSIVKNIVNFSHFNTDGLGSNFFSVDGLFSEKNDPASNSSQGASEVYAIYRRNWSTHELWGWDFSQTKIVKDVAIHMGGDMNTKNTLFAPHKKLLVLGPEIQWVLPKGYLNTSFNYSEEWNHNGIVRKNVHFNPAFEMESNWSLPFYLGKTKWSFTGFFNYIGPKGKDGFGAKTKYEILTRPQVLMDVGQLWGKKDVLEMGAGYEFWLNKFGSDHDHVQGSMAQTPMLIVKAHF